MPNGTHDIERIQREFTEAYRETVDLFAHARCLWAIITHDGYIALTNPYWGKELGYRHDELHFRSFYAFIPQNEHERLLSQLSTLDYKPTNERIVHLKHVDGNYIPFLFWFSQWSEKSSGVRVTYATGIRLEL